MNEKKTQPRKSSEGLTRKGKNELVAKIQISIFVAVDT